MQGESKKLLAEITSKDMVTAADAPEGDDQQAVHDPKGIQKNIDSAQEAAVTAVEKITNLEQDRTEAHRHSPKSQDDVESLRKRVAACKAKVRDLEDQQRIPLAGFEGQAAITLSQAIATNSSRFERMPVGPIGSLLELTNHDWCKAVEASIGHVLDWFVVHCKADREALQNLGKELKISEYVTIVEYNHDFPPLDISKGTPEQPPVPKEYRTVLQVLVFPRDPSQEAVLRNALIDFTSLERHVLVQTEEDALQLAKDESGPLLQGTASAIFAEDGYHISVIREDGAITCITYSPPTDKRPPILIPKPSKQLVQVRQELEEAVHRLCLAEFDAVQKEGVEEINLTKDVTDCVESETLGGR
jgi:hypothetical protein